MSDLKGKAAIVTGSARGIGKGIATRLGQLGARVVVNYATSDGPAQETVAEIKRLGGDAVAIQADLSKVSDIAGLFKAADDWFGTPDIVIANAGAEIVDRAMLDVTEADFDKLFAINTKGAFFVLQEAARRVVDGGRIVYIGSSSTAFPTAGHGLYGGSKLAPQFFVEVLAKEIGKRNITVNSVLPSAVDGAGVGTDGVRPSVREFVRQFHPIQRIATPADVADAVEFLVGDKAGLISGQHLMLSGGGPA